MLYRQAKILSSEALAASGTKVVDITLQDVISRINIDVYGVNNGTTPTAHPAAIVSKIELVDGSDVLCSLSGYEALALDYYQSGRTPFVINNYQDNEWCRCMFNLNFGRYLYDPFVGFNPTKYRNPQLKITYNLAAGGSTPDAGAIAITADVFDGKVAAPAGFLMAKEVVSYTMAASANEYIDMPLDYPYRSMLILGKGANNTTEMQYSNIKLSEDNDKKVPIDESRATLAKIFGGVHQPIMEHFVKAGAVGAVRTFCMTSYEGAVSVSARETLVGDFVVTQPGSGALNVTSAAGATIHGIITGYMPCGALQIPFGDPQVIEDWYDVTKIGNLRNTIQAGSGASSSNTCQVVTEQFRKYAA